MYRYRFVQTQIKSAINKETVLLNWQNINFHKFLSPSRPCNRKGKRYFSCLRTSRWSRIASVGRRCANFDVIDRHETNLPSIKRHSFAWHATQYWQNVFSYFAFCYKQWSFISTLHLLFASAAACGGKSQVSESPKWMCIQSPLVFGAPW